MPSPPTCAMPGAPCAARRGFAVAAIVTLALGSGALTKVFAVLNPLLFHEFTVPKPDQLCRVFSGRVS